MVLVQDLLNLDDVPVRVAAVGGADIAAFEIRRWNVELHSRVAEPFVLGIYVRNVDTEIGVAVVVGGIGGILRFRSRGLVLKELELRIVQFQHGLPA